MTSLERKPGTVILNRKIRRVRVFASWSYSSLLQRGGRSGWFLPDDYPIILTEPAAAAKVLLPRP